MAIVVFIDNAVNAVFTVITVCSIHTVSTFDYMDICGSTVFAVDADMAVSTVSSIFARRRNGNAVLAVFAFDADGTVYSVFAVSTFTADRNRISLQILIQADNHIPIIINHGLDIGGIILGIRFCAGSFDSHGFIQLLGHTACVTGKLQAVVQGSYFMRLILVIGISDTGHTIRTILAVYTVFTLAGLHGKAIFPVFADYTDGAILTVNSYRRAVCTVDADGSVFTISSFFTKVQIIIQIILDNAVSPDWSGGILAVGEVQSFFQGNGLSRTVIGFIGNSSILCDFAIVYGYIIVVWTIGVIGRCHFDRTVCRRNSRIGCIHSILHVVIGVSIDSQPGFNRTCLSIYARSSADSAGNGAEVSIYRINRLLISADRWSHGHILSGIHYCLSCFYILISLVQLAAIHCIGGHTVYITSSHVGDFGATHVDDIGYVPQCNLRPGGSSAGRRLIGNTADSPQIFGKTDFQVVRTVRHDAQIVLCREFCRIRNAADDIDLLIQHLFDFFTCIGFIGCRIQSGRLRITAINHAVCQEGHFLRTLCWSLYDIQTSFGWTIQARCSRYMALEINSIWIAGISQHNWTIVNPNLTTLLCKDRNRSIWAIGIRFAKSNVIGQLHGHFIISRIGNDTDIFIA